MKSSNRILAACLIIASLTCSCKARKPWIANLRRAQVLVNTKPADAIVELERAASAGADQLDVKKGLGIAHERLRHFDEARRLLKEVSTKRPDDPEVRFELANIAVAQNHFDEARSELETVLGLNPPHVPSLLLYAALARTPAQGKAGLDALSRVDRSQFLALVESADFAFARASLLGCTGDVVAAEATLAQADQRGALNPTLALSLAEVSRTGSNARFAEWLLTRASNALAATDAVHSALAEVAIARGHISLASAAVSKLHLYDKPNPHALLLQADLHELKNEPAERARVLKKALDLVARDDPNLQRDVAMKYAIALQRAGNAKQSESVVTALLAEHPGFPPAQLLLATLHLAEQRPDRAIPIAETLVKNEPMRTEAYRVLVSAHLLDKSPDRAEAAARRFVASSSNSPDSVALLANFLIAQKRLDAALHEVELGLERHPHDPELVAAQIELTERTKGFGKAESVAVAAAAGSKSARIQLALAHLYQRNKRLSEALNAMQAAATIDSRALLDLSTLQVQAGNPANALASVEKLVRAEPYNLEAQLRLGMLEERTGQPQRARQTYERVLAMTPENVVALNNLAVLLGAQPGNADRAVQLARKAATLAPNDMRIADTLGWALVQTKQTAERREAVRILERSSTVLQTPESLYHYAAALSAFGKHTEAKGVLTQLLSRKDLGDLRSEVEALLAVAAPATPVVN